MVANRGIYKRLNVVTGDAGAGEAYFNGAGGCSGCHSVTGDLAHIGGKYQPDQLQNRFIWPGAGGFGGGRARSVTVTLRSRQSIAGTLKQIDDIDVSIYDASGAYHSWPREDVRVELQDRLAGQLGVALALFLYSHLAEPGATFTAFALFMGISMSITAFPVLVRILRDRGLFKSSLGSTATACAAVDDVTAWSILAFVVAIAHATSVGGATFSLGLVLLFVALMLFVLKPNLPRWLGKSALDRPEPDKIVLAVVVGVVLLSALCTELIGIHALFGAFLAGIIMPNIGGFRDNLVIRVENLSSVLLLPVFFAFTGLRTQIGLLNRAQDWAICLVIIGVATLGKLGGSALAGRLTGMKWRESLQLGALMNTRGLMELIALNIGYDLAILSQRIFTMLVLMALFTTVMTGPLLTLFEKRPRVAGA